MPDISISDECVQLVEGLSGLGAVDKRRDGRAWRVAVGDELYAHLLAERRPDESWSEVIMRLVREAGRLRDFRA